jgi:hypothetical protein
MCSRRFGQVWKGWSPSRKLAAVVLLVVVVVAGAAIASSNNDGSAAAHSTSDSSTAGGTAGAGATGDNAGEGQVGKDGRPSTTGPTTPPAPLPVKAQVKGTAGLHSGDKVTISVEADKGSFIYAVEMRMCRADAVLDNDGDELPTVTGQCVSKPLAPGTDGFKIAESDGDRTKITADYIVGAGTDTYTMDDGTQSSVTCDADHPCLLWVKYQIPNGFGFRTYPLTFS